MLMSSPKCPYCGEEMEYYWDNNPMMPYGFYYCVTCGCRAPSASTQALAREAAMKRARPKSHWYLRHYIDGNLDMMVCRNCNQEYSYDAETGEAAEDYNFCPNCGADMRKEKEDER